MSEDDYNVYKGKDGQWRGKRQGADKAGAVGETQKDVFDKTREFAKKRGSEVSLHRGDNGRISDKHSYGNDPTNTEG